MRRSCRGAQIERVPGEWGIKRGGRIDLRLQEIGVVDAKADVQLVELIGSGCPGRTGCWSGAVGSGTVLKRLQATAQVPSGAIHIGTVVMCGESVEGSEMTPALDMTIDAY